MSGFPGIKRYQDYCRRKVMEDGYILLNPVTRHKAYIYDFDELKEVESKFNTPGFWEYYNHEKKYSPTSDLVQKVTYYNKRRSQVEKMAINYKIQGSGALCFKLASIKLFNYLKAHNLLFKVKYCVPVHDEINLEAPEAIVDEISKVLVRCMEEGAKPFCTRLKLSADASIGDFWIH